MCRLLSVCAMVALSLVLGGCSEEGGSLRMEAETPRSVELSLEDSPYSTLTPPVLTPSS